MHIKNINTSEVIRDGMGVTWERAEMSRALCRKSVEDHIVMTSHERGFKENAQTARCVLCIHNRLEDAVDCRGSHAWKLPGQMLRHGSWERLLPRQSWFALWPFIVAKKNV